VYYLNVYFAVRNKNIRDYTHNAKCICLHLFLYVFVVMSYYGKMRVDMFRKEHTGTDSMRI